MPLTSGQFHLVNQLNNKIETHKYWSYNICTLRNRSHFSPLVQLDWENQSVHISFWNCLKAGLLLSQILRWLPRNLADLSKLKSQSVAWLAKWPFGQAKWTFWSNVCFCCLDILISCHAEVSIFASVMSQTSETSCNFYKTRFLCLMSDRHFETKSLSKLRFWFQNC